LAGVSARAGSYPAPSSGSASRIRITARFVEVATGAVLRNVKIDGQLSDIFGLQDRIVFELTQDLNLKLEASAINQIQQPETRSVEAYELYSRGVLSLRMATRDAPDKAIHFFERALAVDKDYAEAWAGMGAAYQIKGVFLGLPEMLEKALAAADEALARDPKLAEGYTVRGSAQFALGRLDEALHSYGTAIALDPKNARAHAQLARVHWVGHGDLRAGIAELERAVAINPQFGYAHHQLAYLYTEAGRVRQGRERREEGDLPAGAVRSPARKASSSSARTPGWATCSTARAATRSARRVPDGAALPVVERSRAEGSQPRGAAPEARRRPGASRPHGRRAAVTSSSPSASTRSAPRSARSRPRRSTTWPAAYALLDNLELAVKVLEKSISKQKWNQPRAVRDPDFQPLWPAIEAIDAGERSKVSL
jgi:tetratricopeptide (TPR) repeat protein